MGNQIQKKSEKDQGYLTQIQKMIKNGLAVNIYNAWIDGIQLSVAFRVSKAETKALLFKEVINVVNYIDAKKNVGQRRC